MLDINNCILSRTNFLSFKSMMFENIAPDVTPRNRIIITVKLIFLLGNIMFLILVYLFINCITCLIIFFYIVNILIFLYNIIEVLKMSKKKNKKKTNWPMKIMGIFMLLLMLASSLIGILAYVL